MKANKKQITFAVITIILVGSGSFYGGMKYSDNKTAQDRTARFSQFGGGVGSGRPGARGTGGMTNGGFTTGEVLSQDDKSITLKTRDGSSKIVFFSNTTAVAKSEAGTLADVKTGETVMISGTSNQDGSITAQSIQLRPALPNTPPSS